jgi:hypothetical protein
MPSRKSHPLSFLMRLLALCYVVVAGVAHAQGDACAGYKWDITKERALFAGTATPLTVGKTAASAVAFAPSHFYAVQLVPAATVIFAVPPGKTVPAQGTFAGILALTIPTPGKYRVSLDAPVWIDLTGGGTLLPAADYEGVHGCSAPRKVVEFDLEGRKEWLLQVSGADQSMVRLTVTPVG